MNPMGSLHLGRVRVALPFHNQYLVDYELDLRVEATALEGGGDRRGGQSGGDIFLPGTHVLLFVLDRTSDTSKKVAFPNLILGAFSAYPVFNNTELLPSSIVPHSNADALKNRAYAEIINADTVEGEAFLSVNRSAKRPADVVPGDWFKTTSGGGVFTLSEFFAAVGASFGCRMLFHALDETAELLSKNVLVDTGGIVQELRHRGRWSLGIDRYALDRLEGFGGSPPLTLDDDGRVVPRSDNQAGLFRRVLYSGGAVEGSLDVMTSPAESSPHTWDSAPAPGMLSEQKRMDGIYRLRAAKEILFERTGVIPVPSQIADIDSVSQPADEATIPSEVDDEFRKNVIGVLEEDEVSALLPLVRGTIADAEERQIFFAGLRQESGVWVFPTKADVSEQVYGESEEPTIPPIHPDAAEYTLEDVASIIREVYPGRRIKLFKNSSAFLMADDGSVLLNDGHGSEIRMHRGSITISPAVDLKLAPGRDIVEIVPGKRVSRARGRVEFSSSEGSVAIKAEHNMQLAAGGAAGGVTTIENRSPMKDHSEIDRKDVLAGAAIGGGIMLKAPDAGVSVASEAFHVAGQPQNTGSGDGVDSRASNCDIYMDSGKGTLLMTGDSGYMAFRQNCAMTMLESAVGCYLSPHAMRLVSTGALSLVAAEVKVDKGFGQVTKPVLAETKIRVRKADLPTGEPQFSVQGSGIFTSDLLVTGNIASKKGVQANDGCNPLPKTGRGRITFTEPPSDAKTIHRSLESVGTAMERAMQGMIDIGFSTEFGQHITNFAYPDSSSEVYRAGNYSWLAALWQTRLNSKAVWKETPVVHSILKETYPYPGKDVFERKDALRDFEGGKAVERSLDAYKVNRP